MICPSCGTRNRPGRRFCFECGAALAGTCASCGTPLEEGDKFCGQCGASLARDGVRAPASLEPARSTADADAAGAPAAGPVAERRLVTVLFADLVGFTTLAEERDAEETRELLSRYFALARDVIGRYGGTVEKFIGDAVMAVWGAPVAMEDDAERAVRAGLELLDGIGTLGPGMQARAGIATGEAAVTLGATGEGMVAGDLVNTASRLQSVSSAGTVLVGAATMRAASAAVSFEEAGERTLRGKARPLPAWRALRVVAERGGRGRRDQLEPPFVGREEELRSLKDALHATGRDRRARLISITGPAGIGKSRLAWEFLKYVDGVVEDIYWHSGRSPAYGEGLTFWALGEMVRRRAGLAETDDEATTRAQLDRTLAEYVPQPEDRRWIEPALLALLGLEPSPPGGRDVLFGAWRMFFERIAQRGTTVLVFEDFHWADTGLIDFIDHLLEWARGVPIMVVTLARPELFDRRPDWGAGKRTFSAMALEPLPEAAMRALLTGLVPELPEPAIRTILARADGVPLYAVETVRMLIVERRLERVDSGYRPADDLAEISVPETLRSLIASRLDTLAPADRSLLQDAAVLGEAFTLDGLVALSGQPPDSLEPRLRGLVRRELVALETDPRAPERGQYTFVQGLVREVAYGTLSRRDRGARHLAAARLLESADNDELAGALASHYLAAHLASAGGPETDALVVKARTTLRSAAERAAALGAHEQAVAFVTQALQFPSTPADRAVLLELAAQSSILAGRYAVAERYAQDNVAISESDGDVSATSRATALLATAQLYALQAGRVVPMLERALDSLPSEAAAEAKATLFSILSQAYVRNGQPEPAIRAADQALELLGQHTIDGLFAETLLNKATALGGLGRHREAAGLFETAVRVASESGQVATELRARVNLGDVLIDSDLPQAMTVFRGGLELAKKVGDRGIVIFYVANVAEGALFAANDWDAVLSELDEWLATDVDPGDRAWLAGPACRMRAFRGELDAAEFDAFEHLVRGLADPQMDSELEWTRSEIAWSRGDFKTAAAAGLLAAERFPAYAPASLWRSFRGALWGRDVPQASRIARRIESVAAGSRLAQAVQATARAGVAGLEARNEDSTRLYRDSIRRFEEIGYACPAALTALDMVSVVGPDVPEALRAAEKARGIFERVGARPYLERLEAALAPRGVTAAPDGSSIADLRVGDPAE